MTPGLFALLVVAGGVGASVRYLVDAWIKARTKGSAFPWSTAIINLTGSPALGFLTGLVASHLASTDVSAIVGTGFLGGYTTFSTASYETVQLVREKRYGLAAAYGVGVLVLSVALAFGGYYWGSHL
ncbi:fluoride efflux transporter CrcB [Nocardioides sp. zg-1228]|uniref:fluoride efflux transporter CrcB n=1 Tax=Nocardioides sp. zg-1228 TaxID=2763008 RepID=UPI00164272B9|nr:fluoride efflux transporter CrcB [Nocardioides sp. zg-1228]MBC2933071.1 fluoride efflux transporter CrcB [Nocardioides sp. zg-1228]QSF56739.1 fluoride efflux transporter CrcB [Nocardioides sp. zg-1228]